jgi:ADP-ribosyl-[dinitrogen reductase] hydrolase
MYHTVPVVLFAWFKWHDSKGMFKTTMIEVLNCGGDTDTTGAIIGALSGAKEGTTNIPNEWMSKIADWPRGADMIENHVSALVNDEAARSPLWIFCITRNLLFLIIVLSHGLLRLFPYRKKQP